VVAVAVVLEIQELQADQAAVVVVQIIRQELLLLVELELLVKVLLEVLV
jgi:hypothetical protein